MAQLLAEAIGASIASQNDGLVAAFLPGGVSRESALALARRANSVRDDSSYAVVVSEEERNRANDLGVIETDERGATRYRQGNRLVVFVGQHAGIHSVTETLRIAMSRSFPDEESPTLSLRSLANAAIHLVIESAGAGDRIAALDLDEDATNRLASAFEVLRDGHKAIGSMSTPWTAHWFDHCNIGLERLADALARADDSDEITEVLARFTYAAFALPRPDKGLSFGASRLGGSALATAIGTWWSDTATIESTAALLAANPSRGESAVFMAETDWSGFDRTLVICDGDPLLALAADQGSIAGRLRAFADLSESDFFNPVSGEATAAMTISSASGVILLENDAVPGIHLLDDVDLRAHGDGHAVESSIVSVAIPLRAPVSEEQVHTSRIQLAIASPTCTFEAMQLTANESAVTITGRFVERIDGDTAEFTPTKRRIGVSLDVKDPLNGYLNPRVGTEFMLFPPVGAGVLFFAKLRSRLGPARWFGTTRIDAVTGAAADDDRREFVVPVDTGSVQRVVLWSARPAEAAINGGAPRAISGRRSMWVDDIHPTGSDVIRVDDVRVEVQVNATGDLPKSPVIAAVRKVGVSAEEPAQSVRSSLRGQVEAAITTAIAEDRWQTSLCHFALPVDSSVDVGSLTTTRDGAFLASADLSKSWLAIGLSELPDAFMQSDAVADFRSAVRGLGLEAALSRDEGEAGVIRKWPSQTSWDFLREDTARLDTYLDAYTNMVEAALGSGSDLAAFWATYPFSVSAWTTRDGAAQLQAVLMTPLHPLRLAWLANAEHVLRRATRALDLCGTVEGWNLPFVGPAERRQGRLVAVPIDNGDEQLFLGWSMLVRARTDTSDTLASPELIGGLRAPGSSASGLNAGGVSAAIRDFRRLNPHVTTLSVDLAAATPAQRLEEIDEALLGEVVSWARDSADALPGGVRVFDSTNRRGVAPRDQVRDLVGSKLSAPISWTRYRPANNRSTTANIRILQDAGVSIRADLEARQGYGVVGGTPLRRFEAPHMAFQSNVAESAYGLAQPGEWESFGRALAAAERSSVGGAGTTIESSLIGSSLTSGDAQWIVSGESMVSPASLAALLSHQSNDNTMLWEWRPPFLDIDSDRATTSLLERRPYVSVVRIPHALQRRIDARLEQFGAGEGNSPSSLDVLRVLGARGIGLSSLLSMGDNHESGALGFFLLLQLLNDKLDSEIDQIVLPIDICDNFLRALAGADHAESQRRADLLVMEIGDASVTMIPIEIKFYAARDGLPSPASAALADPLEQLTATHTLLSTITTRWSDQTDGPAASSDRALLANGLAALVEAGLRLSPNATADRGRAASRISSIVNGSASLQVGRPILAFFAGESGAEPRFEAHMGVEDPAPNGCGEHAEFLCDPRVLLGEGAAAPAALTAWNRLLGWAGDPGSGATLGALPPDPTEQMPETVDQTHLGGGGRTFSGENAEPPSSGRRTEPSARRSAEDSSANVPAIEGDGVKFAVGTLQGSVRAASAEFWPSNTRLNQLNVGVVGDLGTGKTQLLKALVANLRWQSSRRQQNPVSVLIFDYKTDFQDREFLDTVGGRLIKPTGIPLNIFGIDGSYETRIGFERARAFVDVLSRIYSGIGPVQSDRLVNTILKLYEVFGSAGPLMGDVLDAYRAASPAADSVVSVLNAFVLGEVFSTDREALVPFGDLMHDAVVVVDLAGLGADQLAKNALVAFFLNQYYEYMQGLTKWPYEGTDPQLRRLNSFLLVDEAVNIMQYKFDVLSQLMLQGREYGVGVILAAQYLSHFQQSGVNYGEPLRTWFIHRVPQVTQRDLARLGLPDASAQDAAMVSSLENHECYYSSFGYPGRRIRGTPYFELVRNPD